MEVMKLWWLALSLLTVVPMPLQRQKTFRTPDRDRTPCQEIPCQDWARLQSALQKHGYMCRCFIVKCVYIAEVHRINRMPCTWVFRGHHKENIKTEVLPSKIVRSLLRGKKHSSKRGITSKTSLIIGVFHVKRKTVTKLNKQSKEKLTNWTSDHHSVQTTDGFPGNAFEDAPERSLWKQVSDLAMMLRDTFPSATQLRIYLNQKASTICPIHQSRRYLQQYQVAEMNMLLESANETASNSSYDAVFQMEKILQFLGMGLLRKEDIFQAKAKDSTATLQDKSDAKMLATDEMLTNTMEKVPLKTFKQRRSKWKQSPTTVITDDEFKAGDNKLTSTKSFSHTVRKPHNVDDKTTESSVTESFETESAKDFLLSTEHLEKKTSESENSATSRKYVNTAKFTTQQMEITKMLTETDCTTELERLPENEESEKKTYPGSKEIRPAVGAVQETTNDGQKHQTSFSGIRLMTAKTTSEKGNTVSDLKDKDDKQYTEQTKHWTALALEELNLVRSQLDIFITKEPQNKPVTPTSFRQREKETGMTTQLPETESTIEKKLSTSEDKTAVERTSTTYEESQSEPVDLILEHLESKATNKPVTPTISRKYAEDFTETRQETTMTTESLETECTTEIILATPEDKTTVEKTDITYEERQSEPDDFISENIESTATNEPVTPTTFGEHEHTERVTDHEAGMTTEHPETECTTEIDLTPENTTDVERSDTTYQESQAEPYDLRSGDLATESTNEAVTPTTYRKYEEDLTVTRQEAIMTTEPLETECTTETDLETPENKTDTTHEERQSEYDDLRSEDFATEGKNELVSPTPSRKYAEDLTETEQDKRMTTEALETERTTEIDLSTPKDKTPVERTDTPYKESKSEPDDFISENIESKSTIEPMTPTTSRKHEHTAIVTEPGVEMTTELPETECTTELVVPIQEEKTSRATTPYEERRSEPVDFISANIESKSTNEPVTPARSREHEHTDTLIEHEMAVTAEHPETEWTTEIELQTSESKMPMVRTDTTYEERQSDLDDLRSEDLATESTNEAVTPMTSRKYAEDLTVTRQEALMTTEPLETECTTETDLETPENKTDTTHEERQSEYDDLRSEDFATEGKNELVSPTPSRKYAEDLTETEQDKRMTTEALETERTTEIDSSTPKDKTPVERTDTPYKESKSEPDDFISENIESKSTTEPMTPTTSRKHEHTAIVIEPEVEMTTEFPETECTTELVVPIQEEKTSRATTPYDERRSEPVDFISANIESKSTNEPVTPARSREHEHTDTLIEHEMAVTAEHPETEWTTEIELQTSESKMPMVRTDTTYEERQSDLDDLRSEDLATKSATAPVTPTTSREHEPTLIVTEHEITSVFPDAGYMTDSGSSIEKPEEVLEKPSMEKKVMMPTIAVPGVDIQSPPSKETKESLQTDEDGCFGLIHRTTSGLKRCQEKMIQIYNLSSEILATGTNELVIPTTFLEDLMKTELDKRMTTKALETERTKTFELLSSEGKTTVEKTDTTYEERHLEPETKGTNEPVTPTTSTKYADDSTVTRQEKIMTTESLETECTTEIILATPEDKTTVERTTTYEETDEHRCFGLIHRTSSGLKRCQEKIKYKFYNTTSRPQEHSTVKYKQEPSTEPPLQNALQSSFSKYQSSKQVTQSNMEVNQIEAENNHFYYFNGKLKRVGNHALRLEYEKNTYTHDTIGNS